MNEQDTERVVGILNRIMDMSWQESCAICITR